MAVADAPLVLVTGASGFIATHLIKQLQSSGKYKVRGTVRSLKNEDKVKELKGIVPDATYPLELVEADLTNEESWKEAVKDCVFVYHVASPFPMASPRDENDLIVPAVNGTLNVLRACAEAGTVKRVVVTSSAVAVGTADDTHTLSEDDWTPDDGTSSAYTKSKYRAERAGWDYVEKLEGDKKFELATVNPGLVVGPFITNSNSGSFDILKAMLTKGMPAIPNVKFGVVDVRDVAAAHIAAMEVPEAAGKRHILIEKEMWMKDIAGVVSREFTPQGYSVPSMVLPKFVAWTIKLFNKDVKDMYPTMGKDISFNTDRMRNVLKIDPLDTDKGIIDSCYSLIEIGSVPKTPGYLGPPESRKPQESTTEEKSQEPAEEKSQEPTEENNQEPAEEKSQEPTTEEKSQETAEEKSQEPAEEKSQEPTEEKSQEPAEEKSQEPAEEKSQEPAEEKSQEPAEEKSQEPAEEKSQEPAEEKSQEPAEEKSQEPVEVEVKSEEPEN